MTDAPTSVPTRATVLVLEHLASEGVGRIGAWLPEAGVALRTVRVHAGEAVPDRLPADCAGLVVMGGAMGVGDADRLPHLREEMALIRRAVGDAVPVLGVCLGAQLLAAACGGVVERGAAGPELGPGLVARRDVATEDPVFASVPMLADVVQWHWDAVTELPAGATLLASSSRYPHQAFRVGERAWGVQFHVETTPSMVQGWAAADADEVRALGLDPELLAQRAGELTPALEEAWRPVITRWAGLLRPPRGC